MNRGIYQQNNIMLRLFVTAGTGAVIAGGVVSAFLAHDPSRFAMWVSAYLVLVVGVAQVGFGFAGAQLVHRRSTGVALLAFCLYNIGNLGVMIGAACKNSAAYAGAFVNIGGVLLIAAVLVLFYGIYGARRSWLLVVFYAVAAAIIISAPIGLILAHQ